MIYIRRYLVDYSYDTAAACSFFSSSVIRVIIRVYSAQLKPLPLTCQLLTDGYAGMLPMGRVATATRIRCCILLPAFAVVAFGRG